MMNNRLEVLEWELKTRKQPVVIRKGNTLISLQTDDKGSRLELWINWRAINGSMQAVNFECTDDISVSLVTALIKQYPEACYKAGIRFSESLHTDE